MTDHIPSEHKEQVSFIHMAKKHFRATDNEYMIPLLFAIPNGGKRGGYRDKNGRMVSGDMAAGSLKMEGVRKGVPDLFFAHPSPSAYGLFIEMKKVKGGTVSKEQKLQMEALEDEGYVCKVARGADQAFQILKDYIDNKI